MNKAVYTSDRVLAIKKSALECNEYFIASALITVSGLNVIKKQLKNKIGKILIGSDLPSESLALQELQSLIGLAAKIFPPQNGKVFHPKIYGFMNDGKMTIYIGSGNWTHGGLVDNQEIFVQVENQTDCGTIKKWFDDAYDQGICITDSIISASENDENGESEKIRFEDLRKSKLLAAISEQLKISSANTLDGFFFKELHYEAFKGSKPFEDSADIDRSRVVDKLLAINTMISPEFKQRNWKIYSHYDTKHTTSTSMLSQAKAINIKDIDCIWLHYGKSASEIKPYTSLFRGGDKGENNLGTFIHHMRLQVILRENCLGVWLVFGKPNASWDRNYMKNQFQNDSKFKTEISNLFAQLGPEYDVEVNGNTQRISELSVDGIFQQEMRDKNFEKYFRIGIDFAPNDDRIREDNIKETILSEFSKLYPIYELCKDKESLRVL